MVCSMIWTGRVFSYLGPALKIHAIYSITSSRVRDAAGMHLLNAALVRRQWSVRCITD
jgi:hypothetical protein